MKELVETRSIVEALYKHAHLNGDVIAVIDNDENQITYKKLWDEVQGFATYLKNRGVEKGDRVVIKSAHTIGYVVAVMAIHLIEAMNVPTEKSIGNDGLDAIANELDAKMVIANDYSTERMHVDFDDIRAIAVENIPTEEITEFPSEKSVGDILFTTGTTGKSKGVMISHRAIVAVCENVYYGAKIPEKNIYMVPNPINHAAGIRKIYVTILTGTTVVLIDGFMNLKKFFQFANDYKVTSILIPPSAIRIIIRMARKELGALSDQLDHIHTGSAPLPDADKQKLRETLPNTRLYFGYGSSEAGCSCLYDYNEYKDIENCTGMPNVNATILIVDEDRKPMVGTKENPGTVAVKGPMNMEGYYNEPELTAAVMQDGIVYTSDLGYMEDGFLHILGRKDDVINIGGLKIAPTEVESVALKYAGIGECVCYATTDRRDNLVICMDVIIDHGCEFDNVDFTNFLGETLEAFKIPKVINIVDEIHKTYNGKINRKAYRQ